MLTLDEETSDACSNVAAVTAVNVAADCSERSEASVATSFRSWFEEILAEDAGVCDAVDVDIPLTREVAHLSNASDTFSKRLSSTTQPFDFVILREEREGKTTVDDGPEAGVDWDCDDLPYNELQGSLPNSLYKISGVMLLLLR